MQFICRNTNIPTAEKGNAYGAVAEKGIPIDNMRYPGTGPPPTGKHEASRGELQYVVGALLILLARTLSCSRALVDLVRPPRAKCRPRELLRRLTSLQKSRPGQLSLDLTSMQRSRPGELLLRFVTRFSQW